MTAATAKTPAAPEGKGKHSVAAGTLFTPAPSVVAGGEGAAGKSAPARTGRSLAMIPARPRPIRVQRPQGAVVHLYDGPLSPSGRRAPRGARAVCNTPTGVLWVESTWGALDPDSRRLCRRCVRRRGSGATSPGTGPALSSRDDYQSFAAGLTPIDLALGAMLAETAEEVWRVELLALLTYGPLGVHSTLVRVLDAAQPLWEWVDRARTRPGCQDPHAARQAAILTEARTNAEITRRSRFQQARREDAAQDARDGRYVPVWQRPA